MKTSILDLNQRVSSIIAGWGRGQNNRPQLPTLRNFGLGILGVFLVVLGMARLRESAWLDSIILVGGGLLLWFWCFGKASAVVTPFVGTSRPIVRNLWLGATIAAIALGLTMWLWFKMSVNSPTNSDWFWYLATIGLVLLAAAVSEPWKMKVNDRSSSWRVGSVVAGIVVVAALTRMVGLGSLPFGTWYDEAANGLEALRVLREPAYRPVYTDGVNSTGHYLWLIVAAYKVIGVETLSIRMISALMGIATVIAAYLAGKELGGKSVGLMWAALFAVARWAITFNRLGMYNSATPLFEVLTLFWLLRGLRRGSLLDFTLAGVSIGLGLCFYSAFQLFLFVLAFLCLVIAWQERDQWRTILVGLVVCTVAALVVIAPIVKYALEKPESYFARVQATSLFADKEPDERLPAFLENSRKHFLMFNLRGDPNGRHNLPGEPMLDWVSGGLLVVGIAICLRRGIAPRYSFILVWIVVGLLGGILSLDFEAPQSLRAIGALPAVLLCAALAPAQLIDEWRSGAGRYFPNLGVAVVALALIIPAGIANTDLYFGRQAHDFASWNAHSTPETIAANILKSSDPNVEKYVISLFDGHPTVRFLAQGVPYRRVETNMSLPLQRDMPNGMMLLVDTERSELYHEARRLYPRANFEEIRSPNGGPVVVYKTQLTSDDLESIEGLYVSYQSEGGDRQTEVRKDLSIDVTWPVSAPVPLPFSADWQGLLAVNSYGPHQFFVEAPGKVTLWIDETPVIEGDGSQVEGLVGALMLARGHHVIHLRAEGATGRVRLAWQPPDGPPETIPRWALYVPPVHGNGLLGEYYANGDWQGEPTFAQIDPRLNFYFHVPTLPRPYTVEWRGKIAIPMGGEYEFSLHSRDESTLAIDGTPLLVNQDQNRGAQGRITLEAGFYDLAVRYADRTDHTFIDLNWRPPGSDPAYRPIPSDLLFPPQANYGDVDVADLARFVQSEPTLPTAEAKDNLSPAEVEVVATGLLQPHGVTIARDIVYVADTGNKRVAAFDLETGEEITSVFESIVFAEPFDLATQPDGSVIVLDSGSAQLLRYDPLDGAVNAVPLPPEFVDRSRGVGAGLANEVWIANTPGQRVVAVNENGTLMHETALPSVTSGEKEMQPVDVAVLDDDSIYVTDVADHMLYRFSLAGYLLSSMPIEVSNSLDSAHLATSSDGGIYMTDPEKGRVVRMDLTGPSQVAWSIRTPEAPYAKPVGIAVDADGTIWVADSQGGRLLKVTPQSAAP